MSPAWWAAFGPAEAQFRCGDARHRLRWADGTLQAVDHPDAEGELVLGALGGDTSPCLDLVASWGQHSDDLSVFSIGPRSASDRITIPPSVLDEITAAGGSAGQAYHGLGNPMAQLGSSGGGFNQWQTIASASATIYSSRSGGSPRRIPPALAARAVAARRARMLRGRAMYGWPIGRRGFATPWGGGWDVDEGRAQLIRLLALGPPFQFRLSAAVAHAWSADGASAGRAERSRPALTAALAGRLAPAAADWLDIDPAEVEVTVHDGTGWGELALGKTRESSRLQARLPVGWLASVWGPGFAVVGGHLAVSVLDAAWPAARVLAVRSPGRDPEELSIRSDKGHWSVTSR